MPQSTFFSDIGSMPITRRRTLMACLAAGISPWLAACDPRSAASIDPMAAPGFKGIDITGADYAQDFALTGFHGTPRRLAGYIGWVVLLLFGFVQCPRAWPTAAAAST